MIKNITLSVEEDLIEKARKKAKKSHTTLNQLFRQWMGGYVGSTQVGGVYDELMGELGGVFSGKKLSRDEMNAR